MPSHSVGERGEFAASPYDIPKRGWWQVLRRVKEEIAADNLSIIAAGVAFFTFLAVFPAIGAFVTIYGLLADPGMVQQQLGPLQRIVPEAAYGILTEQLEQVTAKAETKLSLGLALSLALALWSSTKGTKALLVALNIAYEERMQQNFIWQNVLAVTITIGGIVFFMVSLAVIAVIPAAIELLAPSEPFATMLLLLRWLVVALLLMSALALLYRFGPNRNQARIQWITPGAIVATIFWLAGSVLFSLYVTNIADYNKTFGSLAAVVILLFWFYLSAYVVCVGAELNAELEHQTYRDSTVGPTRPVGSRGAYVADHTARAG